MKKSILLFMFILPVLWSCNQTGSSNVRPARNATHESVNANISLGVEYMRQGSYENALEKLERARQIDPGYYGTYNVLGLFYQQIGQNSQAEHNFKRAISLSNNDAATLNIYGQFLCQTERPDEAEKIFLRAVNHPMNETPEIALTNTGVCAFINGQFEKAESYFRRALELNPMIPDALIKMSQISFDTGKYMSARGYLQRYLEVASHTAVSLWLGIKVEQQLGDDNTVSSYALLLKNNFPDSAEAGLLSQTRIQ